MKRKVITFFIILISFLLQSTLFVKLKFGAVSPNLMLVVTSSFGFMRGRKSGMAVGAISGLNDDIACNFYPELGTYSSNDPEIIRKHIRMHIKANVGVLSVTWWGESDYGNQSVSLLLDEAANVDKCADSA